MSRPRGKGKATSSSSSISSSRNNEALIEVGQALAATDQTISGLTQELEYLESENSVLADRVATMDADKKQHAAAKKFKEAGEVAKEQQGLLADKKEIEDQIKACTGKMDTARDEVAALLARQKECRAEMTEARKQLCVYREALAERMGRLQACLDKFEGGEPREKSAFAVTIPLLEADVMCMLAEEEVYKSRYDD